MFKVKTVFYEVCNMAFYTQIDDVAQFKSPMNNGAQPLPYLS